MANTILIKSLTSAATAPHATNGLKIAELGVNTYDGRVYLGTSLGVSATAGGTSVAATLVAAPIDTGTSLGTSDAKLASQNAIKTYVDANAGSGDITGVTAGDGLTGGGSSGSVTLTLGVDDSTIEISSDAARVKAGGITASHLAANSVDSSELVDGSVDASHMSANSIDSASYVDGSIDTAHIANDQITNALMADDAIDSAQIADGAIDAAHMAANSIDSASYVDGSIDNAHIADDAIDSEHYADGSIDNAHIADDAIDSEHYVNGSVDNVHLANDGITISTTDTSLGGTITFPTMSNVDMGGDFVIGNQSDDTCTITGHLTVAGTTTTTQTIAVGTADTIIFEGATADAYETTLTVTDPTADRTITLPNVTGTVITTGDTATVTATMLAANSVDSSELVNGSVDASHMAANSIDSASYVDGSIDVAHMSANSVDSAQYVDGSIDTAHIANDQITNALMADDAIDSAQIADGAIDNAHIADDQIDSEHYVDGSVDNAHLANDGITIAGADTSLGGTISAATIAAAIDSETMTLTNSTLDGGTYATS